MEPIPANALVQVYDIRSRTKYQFHVRTIHQQTVENLRYQSMAISSPKAPKNPYTNLPWSLGQLIVLYDQMHPLMWMNGRQFLDPAVQSFYSSDLSLDTFRKSFGDQLDHDCARRFFHDPTSEYWDVLYGETLTDLFQLISIQNRYLLRTLLMDRSLPKHFLKKWDDILCGLWCYENLGRIIFAEYHTIHDIIDNAQEMLKETMEHVLEKRAKKREPS